MARRTREIQYRREFLPATEVLTLLIAELKHGAFATGGGEFKFDRLVSNGFLTGVSDGGIELDRQQILDRCAAILGGTVAFSGHHDERTTKAGHEFIQVGHLQARDATGFNIAEDDKVILEKFVAVGWKVLEERCVLAVRDTGIALVEDRLQFNATVTGQHRVQVFVFPTRSLLDQQDLDLGINNAELSREGVVLPFSFIVARIDAGRDFVFAGLVGKELERNHRFTILAEGNLLLVDLFVIELQPHLGRFTFEALRPNPDINQQFITDKGDFGSHEVGDDDVAWRGDADAVNVEGDVLLFELCGSFARGEPLVVGSIGDEDNAGERLPPLAIDHFAQGFANGGGLIVGVQAGEPGEEFGRGLFLDFNVLIGAGWPRQRYETLSVAERDEVEFVVKLRQKIEVRALQNGLCDLKSRTALHRGIRNLRKIIRRRGRIELTTGDSRALDVNGVNPWILDRHAATTIEEEQKCAADATFDGEGQNGAQEQDGQQQQKRAAETEQCPFPPRGDVDRIALIGPPSETEQGDQEEDEPEAAHTTLERESHAGNFAGGLDACSKEFEENLSHAG